jgi:uncharacterized protein (DUF1786 family)
LEARKELEQMVDGRLAGRKVLQDVGHVAASVHNVGLKERKFN